MWRLGPGALPFLGFAAQLRRVRLADVARHRPSTRRCSACRSSPARRWRRMACWILLSLAVEHADERHHLHSMGKLLFAVRLLLGLHAFCQFMLIWIADIPDEIPWFHMRLYGGLDVVGYFLCVFHFALPFVILLSKELKFSSARSASWRCGCSSCTPSTCTGWSCRRSRPTGAALQPLRPVRLRRHRRPGDRLPHLRMRGRLLVPVGDPFIAVFDGVPPVTQPIQEEDRIATGKIIAIAMISLAMFGVGVIWSISIAARREPVDRHADARRPDPAEAGAPEVGIVYQWPFNDLPVRRRQGGRDQRQRASTATAGPTRTPSIVHIPIDEAMKKYVAQSRGQASEARSRPPRCSLAAAAPSARALEKLPRLASASPRSSASACRRDLAFTDENGKRVSIGDYLDDGKPVLHRARLLQVPAALLAHAQRHRRRAAPADVEARQGVPRHHRQLRSRREAGAGEAQKQRGYLGALGHRCPRSTGTTGRSSPATRRNIDGARRRARLQVPLGRRQQDLGPHRGHHGAVARRARSRATSTACSFRRATCARPLRSRRRQSRHHVRTRASALLRL